MLPALEPLQRRARGGQAAATRKQLSDLALRRLRLALRIALSQCQKRRLRIRNWSVLGNGLQRTYRRGRKAMAAARLDPTGDAGKFHEWRKQAKYLWHQLEMLEPICPSVVGEMADQTHRLADYLGDDHDLWALAQAARERDAGLRTAAERDSVTALIDSRRRALQHKALVAGRRLFHARPRSFATKFKHHWQGWHRSRSR